MEKRKIPLSINIIYWITHIVYGLIILIGGAALIFNIVLYTSFFGDDLQLHVQFPVKVNILDEGSLSINKSTINVELVEATSKIHFINTPLPLARKFGTVMLIAFSFLFYLFFNFRKFIANVRNNKVFDDSNVELLRYIAYTLFAFWLFAIIYVRMLYAYIGTHLEFQHVEILEEFQNFAGILMLALFIWVLSHIFERGVKLQEDRDLTV